MHPCVLRRILSRHWDAMLIALSLYRIVFGCRFHNLSLIVWDASLSSYFGSMALEMVTVSSHRSLIHNHMNYGRVLFVYNLQIAGVCIRVLQFL